MAAAATPRGDFARGDCGCCGGRGARSGPESRAGGDEWNRKAAIGGAARFEGEKAARIVRATAGAAAAVAEAVAGLRRLQRKLIHFSLSGFGSQMDACALSWEHVRHSKPYPPFDSPIFFLAFGTDIFTLLFPSP